MARKKGWKKNRKSKAQTRKRTIAIAAKGFSDMTPEAEIEAVYNHIRKYPGKMKSQILKRAGSMGMTRRRLHQRWDTIRDYLRDVGDSNLNRRNPDGEPWMFGVGVKKMKYYATDKSLDFKAADPVTVDIEYAERKPGVSNLARMAEKGAIPVIDEPEPVIVKEPEPDFIKADPEPINEADYVTIRYRGGIIRIPAGSDITLD